jgi:hypothetical protein
MRVLDTRIHAFPIKLVTWERKLYRIRRQPSLSIASSGRKRPL